MTPALRVSQYRGDAEVGSPKEGYGQGALFVYGGEGFVFAYCLGEHVGREAEEAGYGRVFFYRCSPRHVANFSSGVIDYGCGLCSIHERAK
eukprot:scaffold27517_cov42-Cyclotella_meneghiniana.AAC.1